MTKDRPRNRSGNGGKSGGFRGPDTGKPWPRGERPAPARATGEAAGGDDKPWQRGPSSEQKRGEKPGSKQHAKHEDGPRRFDGKPSGRFDKPRGKFDGRRDHRPPSGQYERRDAAFEENGEVWIWGAHAAGAALANPLRRISKAYLSRNAAVRAGLDPEALPKFAELMEPKEIDLRMPPGAVHQGIAIRCKPLDGPDISDAAVRPEKPLVILDQVTDPQNVGAVFRSAAAFGIAGVVMQTRNAPALGGALAKAAAGALERVDEIRAVNISRAIDALVDAGWRVIGLDGSAEQTLEEAFAGREPLAIVMGAEGAGIRHGVAKACSGIARIPIGVEMESLNVSNAAAIAFYEAARRHGAAPPPAKPALPAASGEDEDDDGVGNETD